jgi:hypothetical protein
MEAYLEQRWTEAAEALEEASRLDPGAAAPAFFAGVSRLLAGEADAGARSLEQVVALGETAYLEDGLLHLARARLLQREAADARGLLVRLERLEGERAAEAGELLRRLDSATSR